MCDFADALCANQVGSCGAAATNSPKEVKRDTHLIVMEDGVKG